MKKYLILFIAFFLLSPDLYANNFSSIYNGITNFTSANEQTKKPKKPKKHKKHKSSKKYGYKLSKKSSNSIYKTSYKKSKKHKKYKSYTNSYTSKKHKSYSNLPKEYKSNTKTYTYKSTEKNKEIIGNYNDVPDFSKGSGKENKEYHWQEGYTRKDGTTVKGHYKSNSNKTKDDNWSTKGNTNPFTGKKGKK